MEKTSENYVTWLLRIESARRNEKRLRMIRGMLFGEWTTYSGKFFEGEKQKLINMIDDYLRGDLGW